MRNDWELDLKWNVALFYFINRRRHKYIDNFYRIAYHLGKGYAALLFLPIFYFGSGLDALLQAILALLLTSIILPSIKKIFRHLRPSRLLPDAVVLEEIYYRSFPSADAAFIFTIFSASLPYFNSDITAILGFLAVIISIGRLYMGVHFPLDVIIGAILGFSNAYLGGLLLDYFRSLS